MDRIAASLQRDGFGPEANGAVCASASARYLACFLAIVKAGGAAVPLGPSLSPVALQSMLDDCRASIVFADDAMASASTTETADPIRIVYIDDTSFQEWLLPEQSHPTAVAVRPDQPFNIIYSSGTTGKPKGIVQPHSQRWAQAQRLAVPRDTVTLASTPLYSNTTLVSVFPTLAHGGTVVLMPRFDALEFLRLAEKHRATNAMLVPVQYRRLLDHPSFDDFDLSSFRTKQCTSAPFGADLKREILRRWPGELVEIYAMTEGGGSAMLRAHAHPDKLHTVGQPMPGCDIRLIDDEGREVANGCAGEIVGRSPSMMQGYYGLAERSREAEWHSPEGLRFIKTGDIGQFDEDGFLSIIDRKKDLIISGGFNVYPSDLELVLSAHPDVAEVAVFGIPSATWGETPAAVVVLRSNAESDAETVRVWANERLGRTQRVAAIEARKELPRSPVGKVLKRELRESFRPIAPV